MFSLFIRFVFIHFAFMTLVFLRFAFLHFVFMHFVFVFCLHAFCSYTFCCYMFCHRILRLELIESPSVVASMFWIWNILIISNLRALYWTPRTNHQNIIINIFFIYLVHHVTWVPQIRMDPYYFAGSESDPLLWKVWIL
jgi:hypothetical protein